MSIDCLDDEVGVEGRAHRQEIVPLSGERQDQGPGERAEWKSAAWRSNTVYLEWLQHGSLSLQIEPQASSRDKGSGMQ